MISETKFRIYDQVRYVPRHANGDVNHKDVEQGIVTSVFNTGIARCLFFRKDMEGLRTLSNTEIVNTADLVKFTVLSRGTVYQIVEAYGSNLLTEENVTQLLTDDNGVDD